MSYYYYKLKCVHCMREIKPENVVYKNQNSYEKGKILEKKGAKPIFGQIMLPKSLYSDSDNKIIDENDAKKKINNYPFFKNNMIISDIPLITEYEYEGKKLKRRCPHCQSLLLDIAGTVPIFNVSMIGFSTVGKTVMLVMQYLASKNYIPNAIDNFIVYGGIVSITANTTHLEKNIKDEIAVASKDFHDNKIILGTTGTIPPPHCMVASYRELGANGGVMPNRMMTCVICFRDVVGESFTTDGNEHRDEFEEMASFCQKSDGIFILSDCTKLKKMYEIATGETMRMDNPVNVLAERISNEIFSQLTAQTKPVVSILSKIDELQAVKNDPKYSSLFLRDGELPRDDQDKRINKHSEVLAEGQNFAYRQGVVWYEDIFNKVNKTTKNMLMFLDNNGVWYNAINAIFENIAYFPVSSIGGDVDFIEVMDDDTFKKEFEKKKEELTETANDETIDENIIPLPVSPEIADMLRKKAKENSVASTQSDKEVKNKIIEEKRITFNKRIISKELKKELDVTQSYTNNEITELEKRKNIRPIEKIKPRCLELPLLYLLMKFGIIPDMSNPENYSVNRRTRSTSGFLGLGIFSSRQTIEETVFSDDKYQKWLNINQQIPVNIEYIEQTYEPDLNSTGTSNADETLPATNNNDEVNLTANSDNTEFDEDDVDNILMSS